MLVAAAASLVAAGAVDDADGRLLDDAELDDAALLLELGAALLVTVPLVTTLLAAVSASAAVLQATIPVLAAPSSAQPAIAA